MNLILLLSALLSAISGATGVRAAQTPTTLASSVVSAVKATAQAQAQVAARPVPEVVGPAHVAVMELSAFTLLAGIPAYANRRRE